jgi:hypothetical protein
VKARLTAAAIGAAGAHGERILLDSSEFCPACHASC